MPVSDSRDMSIVAVIGVLVVLLALLWFWFLVGRDGERATPGRSAAAPSTNVRPAVKAGKLAASSLRGGPVRTFEMFAPKDPFASLVSGAPSEVAGSGSNARDSSTAPGLGGESVGGHRVRLVDVFEDKGEERAQLQVDSTVYTVGVGDTFADNFKLLSASGDCASMLFGDDQFSLCEGEEILK